MSSSSSSSSTGRRAIGAAAAPQGGGALSKEHSLLLAGGPRNGGGVPASAAATATAEVVSAEPAPPASLLLGGVGSSSAAWLEDAVQAAVRHIGGSACGGAGASAGPADPFLLLVRPRPGVAFDVVPLPRGGGGIDDGGAAALAGGWAAFASLRAGGDGTAARGCLLVQPVASEEAFAGGAGCVAAQMRVAGREDASSSTSSSRSSGTGRPTGTSSSTSTAECAECMAAADAANVAPGGVTVAQGRVGDCCDDGTAQRGDGASCAPTSAAAASPPCALHSQVSARFYGVVVIGGGSGASNAVAPAAPAASGAAPGDAGQRDCGVVEACYLLKTTHTAAPSLGCACSHYVLTRVSKGPALSDQLVQSWLA